MLVRGVPEHIRSDNGAEMTAKVVRNWLTQVGEKVVNKRGACRNLIASAALDIHHAKIQSRILRQGDHSS